MARRRGRRGGGRKKANKVVRNTAPPRIMPARPAPRPVPRPAATPAPRPNPKIFIKPPRLSTPLPTPNPAPQPQPTPPQKPVVNLIPNFGKRFGKTGKFGKKGRQQIKALGFQDVADFKNQLGITGKVKGAQLRDQTQNFLANRNSPPSTNSNAGPSVSSINGTDFVVDTFPPGMIPDGENAPQAQAPTTPNVLGAQAQDQAAVGANFLAGSPGNQTLNNNANFAQTNASNFLNNNAASRGQFNNFLQGSVNAQIPSGVQALLDRNRQGRVDEVNSIFSPGGEKFDQLQTDLANLRADAQQRGLFNSSSRGEAEAELQRKLLRDKSSALTSANEFSRAEELNQLNAARSSNLSAAGLSGELAGQDLNAALNFLGQSNSAANAANAQDLGFRELGANILNQGINNQLSSAQLQALLQMQQFEASLRQMDALNANRQQALENITSAKNGRQQQKLFKQLMEQYSSSGGSSLGNIFGGALSGAGTGFSIGGPIGAGIGAIGGGLFGAFS